MSDNVNMRYFKSDERCQVIFDKLIKALDEDYQLFLDRKAPYNQRVKEDDGKYDPNWKAFIDLAETIGKEAVHRMGLSDYDLEFIWEEFEYADSKSELNSLVKEYKQKYKKKHIPEVVNLIVRIEQGWNDKYVYVWNEKSLHTRQSKKSVETISKEDEKYKPYLEEIKAGLTDEALDCIYDNGEEDLISDDQLSLIFKPKFWEDEELEYPEAREFALRYDKETGKMMMVLNFEMELLKSVKCDPNDVQSIISSAIECLNHCTRIYENSNL